MILSVSGISGKADDGVVTVFEVKPFKPFMVEIKLIETGVLSVYIVEGFNKESKFVVITSFFN